MTEKISVVVTPDTISVRVLNTNFEKSRRISQIPANYVLLLKQRFEDQRLFKQSKLTICSSILLWVEKNDVLFKWCMSE